MSKPALYKKILEVMKDVRYLQKDDSVSAGATSYKAISEEKVTETVRASLIEHGLIIIPVEQEHTRTDTPVRTETTYQGKTTVKDSISRLSTVNTKYKIIDVDTGEYEILASSGTGVDTQDKGVGKAMTYSYKYLFLRTFAIPTGEDPDKISSEDFTDKLNGDTKPTTSTAQQKQPTGQPDGSDMGTETTEQPPAQFTEKPISEAQMKKISTLCGQLLINEPQGKELLKEKYQKSSCKELTSKQASGFIDYLIAETAKKQNLKLAVGDALGEATYPRGYNET